MLKTKTGLLNGFPDKCLGYELLEPWIMQVSIS